MRKVAVAGVVVALASLVACSSPARPPAVQPPAPPVPVAAAPAPAPAPAPPAFRLSGDVVPHAGRLELTIVPARTDAPGHIGFDAEVIRPTRVVWLHATDIAVTAATLGGAPARVIPGGDSFVGLTTDRELPPGPLAIEADFTSHIDHERSRGLYSEKSGAETYSYTFFEAIDARRAFPCFDEPAFKIPWTLTFHVQADHVALGNAPVASETPEAGGMKRVRLAPSKPLPSYLVAFVVGPFDIVDDGVAGRAKTPVRFIVPKGRGGELGWAKEITPKIVAALEDYFDMPYPYVKLDVAVVPRYWGTMEHPGLLAMGQPLSLIRPDQATRDRKEGYANIAAHELSHYWFGDYVTMAWWNDTWLNEAQGEWLDAIITDAVLPGWHYELTRVDRARWAMSGDETLATQAIQQPVVKEQDIEAAFDGGITYLKGSSVLRMFEAYVGRDAWRAFIRGYERDHAWGNATADDFFGAVRAKLGAPVEAGLRSFIAKPGVPRIGMALDCATPQKPAIVLHQSRALPVGVTDPDPHTWTVPVCVRYGAGAASARACTLLDARDGRLELAGACPTWIVPNADAAGYYRSAPASLASETALVTPGSRLAALARPTTAERLMIIADLRAAIDRDEMTLDAGLALVPRVIADPDPRIANAAGELGSFKTNALDDDLYARAQRFWTSVYRPTALRLGWSRRPGDSDDTQNLRRSAHGIAPYDPRLAAEAAALARRWLAGDHKGIDDDMVDTILGAAAFHGDAALFDQVLARAKSTTDAAERDRLVGVLGSFRDPALAARALGTMLGTELDLRESMMIAFSEVAQRETRAQALTFLEAHLDQLTPKMRDDDVRNLLGFLGGAACDAPTRDRIQRLVRPRAPKFSGAEAAVDHALAESGACIASFDRQLPMLRAFLLALKP